ncbi:MAG: DoxX family protein [Bacteroidota bacterium]
MAEILAPLMFAKLISSLLLAILFLQSGLDKVFDWKGNLGWLNGHFAKTPLKSIVPFLLGTVTLVELAAGALSAFGVVALLTSGSGVWALYGAELSALSLLMLFFGQRIAKDYAGAATLVMHSIFTLLAILLHSEGL